MEAWIAAIVANGYDAAAVVLVVGILMFRGQLISGPEHRRALKVAHDVANRAEDRADRWEAVALKALDATERLTEPVETAAKVLTKIPTPEGQD